jgi:predicted dehydrogenase
LADFAASERVLVPRSELVPNGNCEARASVEWIRSNLFTAAEEKGVSMADGTMRIGVVGLGGWGKNVVRSFASAPRCELAYFCDANADTLKKNQQLYPRAKATNEYQHLLDDPTLDAVGIVTPAPMHFEMAKAALNAGKHVYVEKPMTLLSEHAEELVELADRNQRKLMVGHLLEYHPAVNYIKQMVDAGDLGDVMYVYCQRLNLGVVRQHENAFWSLAPHDISVILYLLGEEPVSVQAMGGSYLQSDVEDVVFSTMQFADGRMAQIHVSWLDPNKERKIVVVGSKKMVVFDDMQASEKIRIYDKGANKKLDLVGALQAITVRHGDIVIPSLTGGEPLDIETRHFVDAVLNDTTPRSDGRDGLRVVRILEAVDRLLHEKTVLQPDFGTTPALRRYAA